MGADCSQKWVNSFIHKHDDLRKIYFPKKNTQFKKNRKAAQESITNLIEIVKKSSEPLDIAELIVVIDQLKQLH